MSGRLCGQNIVKIYFVAKASPEEQRIALECSWNTERRPGVFACVKLAGSRRNKKLLIENRQFMRRPCDDLHGQAKGSHRNTGGFARCGRKLRTLEASGHFRER